MSRLALTKTAVPVGVALVALATEADPGSEALVAAEESEAVVGTAALRAGLAAREAWVDPGEPPVAAAAATAAGVVREAPGA